MPSSTRSPISHPGWVCVRSHPTLRLTAKSESVANTSTHAHLFNAEAQRRGDAEGFLGGATWLHIQLKFRIAIHYQKENKRHSPGWISSLPKEPGDVFCRPGLIPLCASAFLPKGGLLLDALHIGAELVESGVQVLVTPLDLPNIVDHALALGDEGGDDERHTGANVRAGQVVTAKF